MVRIATYVNVETTDTVETDITEVMINVQEMTVMVTIEGKGTSWKLKILVNSSSFFFKFKIFFKRYWKGHSFKKISYDNESRDWRDPPRNRFSEPFSPGTNEHSHNHENDSRRYPVYAPHPDSPDVGMLLVLVDVFQNIPIYENIFNILYLSNFFCWLFLILIIFK